MPSLCWLHVLHAQCRYSHSMTVKFLDLSRPLQNAIDAGKFYHPSEYIRIIPEFLSVEEHETLVKESTEKLERLCSLKYDEGHYDQVIKGYKECSVSSWAQHSVLLKAQTAVCSALNRTPDFDWVPPHILELREKDSFILPHVDNLMASGDIVAGICLLSDATMEFTHNDDTKLHFVAFLPKRALYMQWGKVRYDYKHAIPCEQVFRGEKITKQRRISILLRNQKNRFRNE